MTHILSSLTDSNDFLINLLIACLLALVFATAALMLKRALLSRIKKLADSTNTLIDDWALDLLNRTHTLPLIVLAAWAGTQWLSLPANHVRNIDRIALVVLIVQCGFWLHGSINFWLANSFHRQDDTTRSLVGPLVGFLLRTMTWTIILLMILDNLGINVTTLVASLGIGGIAVALAVQNILSDLLASLSIALDRPFVIGDFIVVDTLAGTIEHVGLKTTRISSLTGEQIIISNNDLLKSRIHNYKRMRERRVLFRIGIVYQTPVPLVEQIPALLREIIEAQDGVRFDRAHFHAFGPSSLDFEVVYFILDNDYNQYMDTQQAINFAILQRFAAEGIDFAFPTQTVHLIAPVSEAAH